MPTFSRLLVISALTAGLPTLAHAQDAGDSDWEEDYAPGDDPGQASAPPTAQAPTDPPPSTQVPPPPAAERAPDADVPSGQWVRTSQYGWVWMPYADAYTYVPPDGYGEPYTYVWRPALGWCWVAAPWVWGFGPWPYFGVYAPVHFGWYAHGWWRTPHRWHWVHQPFYGYRGGWHGGGRGWGQGHPARPGGGWSTPRPAPGFRSGFGGGRAYGGAPHGFGGRGFSGGGISGGGPRGLGGMGGRHR